MKINFVGLFSAPSVTGEVSDETHLAEEMENLGHEVKRIPRDIWKAYVEGRNEWPEITDDLSADVNIIAKWHHFTSSDIIGKLREKSSGAPVMYWVWDYMFSEGFPDWHLKMCHSADRYLSNEGGLSQEYAKLGINHYYFPFDVSDKVYDKIEQDKIYDVAFFGSCIGQGQRREWLPQIDKAHRLKVFSWNWQEWQKLGLDAEPAVYGEDFAKRVAQARIILQFSVNDGCWGYWSNRVGKVLTVGGFLLARYAPGMELFLRDGCDYFSSVGEAVDKIGYYLEHDEERERISERGYELGRDRFTSHARVKELLIMMERYVKENPVR
jgi:spore maturation protein CgeB